MPANADPEEFIQALHGLDFPASRAQVLNKARDKGGLDTEVIAVLERLADRTYDSPADLRDEVIRVYNERPEDGTNATPAAPSPLSNAAKDLIRTMADPRRGDIKKR